MKLFFAFLLLSALWATTTYAQDHPDYIEFFMDEFQLTCESDDRAVLYYANSDQRLSSTSDHEMSAGCINITVHLESTGGPENITVTLPEGWVPIPFLLSVADGFQGEMVLVRGVPDSM